MSTRARLNQYVLRSNQRRRNVRIQKNVFVLRLCFCFTDFGLSKDKRSIKKSSVSCFLQCNNVVQLLLKLHHKYCA